MCIESYLCMCCNRVLKYVAEAADKQVCPRERSRADEGALMSGCPSPLYLISAGLRSGTWDRACWRRLLLCPNKRLQTCPCHLLKGAARVSLSHSYTHTPYVCLSLTLTSQHILTLLLLLLDISCNAHMFSVILVFQSAVV